MSALDDLKTRIDSAIYTNTEQNITGDGLQTVLDDMVDTMGVSVSQNTDTGKEELKIGDDVKWILDNVPTRNSNNLVKSGGTADRISKSGIFLENCGGIRELFITDTEIDIKDLHLVYKTTNHYHIIFFDSNATSIAETIEVPPTTDVWPSPIPDNYEGIIPIYKTSTIGSTNVVVGYVIVDWNYWPGINNVVVADITDAVYNISYSPTIFAFLNSKSIDNEIERATDKESDLQDGIDSIPQQIDSDINGKVYGYYVKNNVSGNNNNAVTNLNIPIGTSLRFVIDTGKRLFQYANIYVVEGGEAKTLTNFTDKGIVTYDYTTVGVITVVSIQYKNITQSGDTSLSLINIKALGIKNDEMYLKYLRDGKLNFANSPITSLMFNDTDLLASTLNTAFEDYATLCKCSKYAFCPFFANDISTGRFIYKINHNFRQNVIADGMTNEEMARLINYQLTIPINRFNDAVLNDTNGIKSSIATGMPIGEPSAIVSDDGSTLYIYCGCLYRYKSVDGMKFELDHNITIDGVTVTQSHPDYLMHCNVNLINGVYYLIGTHANHEPLMLWKSTDGWNFTKTGILLEIGDVINSNNDTIGNFGNTFLHYDENGLWYLYYEMTKTSGSADWEICLATCPNINVERSTGKYGVWTQCENNPILKAVVFPYTARTTGKGNPNIVCGLNNRALKHDGKYYMYLHGNSSWGGNNLFRASSINLVDWEVEGIVYNNRDIPTAGETAPGNGDQCIVEFKGRTLLFYTWDINDYPRPEQLKLTIDDRPLFEILELLP